MKLVMISRPVSKKIFSQIHSIVKKISAIQNTNGNEGTIVFLDSSDTGKKYIIIYDKKEHKACKLLWKIIPNK